MSGRVNVFNVTATNLENVIKSFNRSTESIKDDVEKLQEWLKTQKQFPDLLDSHVLQNFLIMSKCSIQVTKQRIENYYTVRVKLDDIYGESNPKLPNIKLVDEVLYFVPYPVLTKEMYRITYFKVRDDTFIDKYHPIDGIRKLLAMVEIRLREDIISGDIYVLDCTKLPFSLIAKLTPALAYKSITMIYQKIYFSSCKAIYFVNMPSYINPLVNLSKSLITPKLASRIYQYPNLDSLKSVISPELIPPEFGGNGTSLELVQKEFSKKFIEYEDLFDRLDALTIDEALRPEKLENDDLSLYGNFKALEID